MFAVATIFKELGEKENSLVETNGKVDIPANHKKCNDIYCLIAFGVVVLLWLILFIYSCAAAKLYMFLNPQASEGVYCGVKTNVSDQRKNTNLFVYRSEQWCVKSCPSNNERCMCKGENPSSLNSSECGRKGCYYVSYDYSPVNKVCIAKESSDTVTEFVNSFMGSFISGIWMIVAIAFIAIALCAIWIAFMACCARGMVWCCLIGSVVAVAVVGLALFIVGVMFLIGAMDSAMDGSNNNKTNSAENFSGSTQILPAVIYKNNGASLLSLPSVHVYSIPQITNDTKSESRSEFAEHVIAYYDPYYDPYYNNNTNNNSTSRTSKKQPTIGSIVGPVLMVVGAIVLLSMCCCSCCMYCARERIELAARLTAETSYAIRTNPLLPVITTLVSILTFGVSILFVLGILCLVTSYPVRTVNGVPFIDVPGYSAIWYIFSLFGFIWMVMFLSGINEMTIGGTIATWYFSRDKAKVSCFETFKAFWRTIRYSPGSVAFGSGLIALCAVLRMLQEQAASVCKQGGSPLVLLCCLIDCILSCIMQFLEYINSQAYVIISIKGTPFFETGKQSILLMIRNIFRSAVLNSVIPLVMGIAETLIVLLSLFILFLMARPMWFGLMTQEYAIAAGKFTELGWILNVVIGLFVIVFVVSTIFDTYTFAITSMFISFLLDEEMAITTPTWEKFGSKKLLKHMDEAARKGYEKALKYKEKDESFDMSYWSVPVKDEGDAEAAPPNSLPAQIQQQPYVPPPQQPYPQQPYSQQPYPQQPYAQPPQQPYPQQYYPQQPYPQQPYPQQPYAQPPMAGNLVPMQPMQPMPEAPQMQTLSNDKEQLEAEISTPAALPVHVPPPPPKRVKKIEVDSESSGSDSESTESSSDSNESSSDSSEDDRSNRKGKKTRPQPKSKKGRR
ncbi:putative Choline Transporter-like (CTL) Family Protein [Monocercomonoides exilis]|uniref:putative Choline Transporter-like (CTL) Family Protein n=1 Tax=Monocercomonoides exilis TaxID=2049356 RepID=UPI0035595B60|nr:putative Choline Transporter-like (CTL) Family Protein [Monocercomonoides exilis]|eukprot:MONOS_10012.1-p1 / transcript=MONOS_10012.1 / gene=MONOS_10012 / organism=Monocercomonoides_exilis_PA203 / gene_product=Choline Transporter-like (CTL) Family Protein / transcript_product=Choline Transporter-like (CTL) Family Protein / location=Mono_scaffold00437:8861-11670(-) / protein_length=900 / sequence_SO=supercontig / SO=protein_coding / is_pseudo=false